jgi:hypothetical protein
VYPDLSAAAIWSSDRGGERRADKERYKQCILTWVESCYGLQTEGERRAEKEIYKKCILTWVESCQARWTEL